MATRAVRVKKTETIKPLTKRKSWTALKAHAKDIQATDLKKLFA